MTCESGGWRDTTLVFTLMVTVYKKFANTLFKFYNEEMLHTRNDSFHNTHMLEYYCTAIMGNSYQFYLKWMSLYLVNSSGAATKIIC